MAKLSIAFAVVAVVLVGCASEDNKFRDQAPPPSADAKVESNPKKNLIGGEAPQGGSTPAQTAPAQTSRDQAVN